MLGVMCLVALLQLICLFLLVLSVLVFSAYRLCVLMCAVCSVVGWRCFADVLWCCEFEIAPTLFRCVLEFRCGQVGVVSVYKAEAQPVCSCGGWGLMTVLNREFISPGFCSGLVTSSWSLILQLPQWCTVQYTRGIQKVSFPILLPPNNFTQWDASLFTY